MPYPYLPDRFRERYPSVWVDLPAGEIYDPVKAIRSTTIIWINSSSPSGPGSTASASTSITRTATA